MGSGAQDRAEGKWDQAKGKVKETVGEATDHRSLETEGRAKYIGIGLGTLILIIVLIPLLT